jgi:hypothetical protein
MKASARAASRLKQETRRVTQALNSRYEAVQTPRDAVTAGRNLVAIGGQLYPAEGVEGSGAAAQVVNVGTPAVARYVASNRRSVVSVAGTGVAGSTGGGGGGGTYTAGDGITIASDVISVDAADIAGTNYGLTVVSNDIRINPDSAGALEFNAGAIRVKLPAASGLTRDSTGLYLADSVAGDGLAISGKIMSVGAGNGIAVSANSIAVQRQTTSGLDLDSNGLALADSIAGAGLTISSKVLAVGVANTGATGLTVEANAVRLTSSSNPGAAASILATSAAGSLQLDTDLLYVDADTNTIGINRTPDGGAALDVMSANNSDHTLRVKQKSGQTARLWRVENSSGQELIVLDSQGNLQSGNPGFVSGLTGWQISHTGDAEFNNGWFRGELHAATFVADEMHATGGTIIVATVGKLLEAAVIDSDLTTVEELEIVSTAGGFSGTTLDITSTAAGWTGTTLEIAAVINYLDLEDPPSGHYKYFYVGDVIRTKPSPELTGKTTDTLDGTGLDIYDLWFTVVAIEDMTTHFRYYVKKEDGTDTTIPAGAAVVSFGQAGDGRILITSDLNKAPYLDVFTVGPSPWTGDAGALVPHVRLGRLDGVGVTAVSGIQQYGLIAGTDLSDADSPYIVASNLQLALNRVDATWSDGTNPTASISSSGRVKFGTDIDNSATTGFDFDPATGNLTIGNGSYPATVSVTGSITVTGGNAATQTYADSAASTAASTAQTTAQGYGSARRLVACTVFITPTGERAVSWLAGNVRFGDGTTKSVSAGSYSFSGPAYYAYLYVDATASAPLTLSGTTDITTLGANHVLVAVITTGNSASVPASVFGVANGTFISGAHIYTGSIVADNIAANAITAGKIQAGAITADKISVTNLSAVNTNTGNLTVTGTLSLGTAGAVASSGKTWNSNTAGYFLGYNGSAYVLEVGERDGASLAWDGSSLTLTLNESLNIVRSSSDYAAIVMTGSGGNASVLRLTATGLGIGSHLYGYTNGAFDLLQWRNIGSAANKITTAYITTLGDSSTGRATNLYTSNADVTTLTGGTAEMTGQIQAAQIGVTSATAGSYYNLSTTRTAIGSGGTSYGSGWGHYSTGDSEKLYFVRAGNLVTLFGWCKKSSGTSATILTGLPGAVIETVAPVRSSIGPDLGGGGDVISISTTGTVTFIYNTSGPGTPSNVDLIINVTYQHNGYNTDLL